MKNKLPSKLKNKCQRLEKLAENIKSIVDSELPVLGSKEGKSDYEIACLRLSGINLSLSANRDCLILGSDYDNMERASKRLRRGYKKLQGEKEKGIMNVRGIVSAYVDYLGRRLDFSFELSKAEESEECVRDFYKALKQGGYDESKI